MRQINSHRTSFQELYAILKSLDSVPTCIQQMFLVFGIEKKMDKGRKFTQEKSAYFKAVFFERANSALPIIC